MSAEAIIRDLHRRGVRVAVDGEKLIVKGKITDTDRQVIRSHKPEIVRALHVATADQTAPQSAARQHWLVRFSDREPEDVMFGSPLTAAEAIADSPGAVSAEPVHPRPARSPTPAEVAELRTLIAVVLEAPQDRAEALSLATANPDSGMTCWRALAARYRV